MRKPQPHRWASVALALALGVTCVSCFSVPIEYTAPKAVLDPYTGTVTEIVSLLDQGKGDDAKALLDDLQGAVVEARALLTGLYFSGASETLTDPLTLPVGTYRVHCKTEGYLIVRVVDVASADWDGLFSISGGNASSGISAVYRSEGNRIMLEFSIASAPYELWFEEVK
jgi:hypothetical protein